MHLVEAIIFRMADLLCSQTRYLTCNAIPCFRKEKAFSVTFLFAAVSESAQLLLEVRLADT
jgi:hypothetical protein